MDSFVYSATSMLKHKRLSPETPASELFGDWLNLTLKAVSTTAGASECTVDFYDIRGKKLSFSGIILSNSDGVAVVEYPLAAILRDDVVAGAAWSNAALPDLTVAQMKEIAMVEFSGVSGTVYYGNGGSMSGDYGEFNDSTTFSVSGLAADGTLTITNGAQFGFGAS